jgi:hypothetical protein
MTDDVCSIFVFLTSDTCYLSLAHWLRYLKVRLDSAGDVT